MNPELERCAGWPRKKIAGVDEVGRGCWAGPVVAAAVILPASYAVSYTHLTLPTTR